MSSYDVKARYIAADTAAASAVSVSTSATVTATGGFTLTATGGVVFTAARIITATTAGTSDGGKVVTITGTNINGAVQTEDITLASSATTVSGTSYFKSVTAATIDTTTTGNVALGNGAGAADVVTAGRARIQNINLVDSAAAGVITFRNTMTSGDVKMQIGTTSSAANQTDIVVPGRGVLFEDGAYVTYTGGSSPVFTSVTVFYE